MTLTGPLAIALGTCWFYLAFPSFSKHRPLEAHFIDAQKGPDAASRENCPKNRTARSFLTALPDELRIRPQPIYSASIICSQKGRLLHAVLVGLDHLLERVTRTTSVLLDPLGAVHRT